MLPCARAIFWWAGWASPASESRSETQAHVMSHDNATLPKKRSAPCLSFRKRGGEHYPSPISMPRKILEMKIRIRRWLVRTNKSDASTVLLPPILKYWAGEQQGMLVVNHERLKIRTWTQKVWPPNWISWTTFKKLRPLTNPGPRLSICLDWNFK